jgi:lipoyl(octanoyl) transferase
MAGMVVSVVYLGRVRYSAGLELQARLVGLRKAGAIGDVLVMLEHEPVLTLGRAMGRKDGGRDHLVLTEEALRARGVEVVETNRGGDVTYHGPGQLVGYPIFDLRGDLSGPLRAAGKRLGPVDFVRLMEEALIRAMADYGVAAQRVPGRTGVWTQPNAAVQERKLAAIGIHVSAGVTSHGFALNVTTDLKDFEWIVPCGIRDRGVTSLELESRSADPDTDLALQTAAERVARQFGHVFQTQVLWLESLDQLAPLDVHARA